MFKVQEIFQVCRNKDPAGAGDLVESVVAERAEGYGVLSLVDEGNAEPTLGLELLEELSRVSYCCSNMSFGGQWGPFLPRARACQ